jgi:hypothetical protein
MNINFKEYYELLWEAFDTPTSLLLNPDNNSKSWQRVYNEFEATGGYMLGSGAFGNTFFHPSWPYILKTFAEDDAYLRYIRWIHKQPSNPAFPKIYGLPTKITPNYIRPGKQRTMYVLRMEKLEPIDQDTFNLLEDELGKVTEQGEPLDVVDPMFKPFVAAYAMVDKARRELRWGREDLHAGNIMVRPSTGDYVITDPVASNTAHPKKPKPLLRNLRGGKALPTRRERFKMKRDRFKPGDRARLVGYAQDLMDGKVYTVLDVQPSAHYSDLQLLSIETEYGNTGQFESNKFLKVNASEDPSSQ